MIIVTGASRGIGLAICQRLTQKNIAVLGLARTMPSTQADFQMRHCDVTKTSELKEVVKEIKLNNWEIDGLINCAGMALMNLALFTPPEATNDIIATNLIGTINSCQAFAPLMVRNKRGSIISFSSLAVDLAIKGESAYVAAKAGIEGFSKVFAREMADFNIRVNCIAPGPIDTNLIKNVPQDKISSIISQQIIPKKFTTDDICNVVELLLDDRSFSLTGEVFHIGGH